MPDHVVEKKVLLVGAGPMAQAYAVVLKALGCSTVVVGRGEASALKFEEAAGLTVQRGGLEAYLAQHAAELATFDAAIVATPIDTLGTTTQLLLASGWRSILLEKPGGIDPAEISELAQAAATTGAHVYLAYNRRFYASVLKALELIEEDGGVTSLNFEFTEWSHVIEKLALNPRTKANWLLASSSHVIDMAFHLGGKPTRFTAYAGGQLAWHDKAIFGGAGRTDRGAIFTYQANWAAPGRWGVEALTAKRRFIFRPLEELHVQQIGSVAITKFELDDSLDKTFKPGLYWQTLHFLQENEAAGLLSLAKYNQLVADVYQPMVKGTE
ncbi:MAG: Gfo/Idh/MocA family oxidoreductase [Hymenobacteraceae bacterium]|nr:Gfo/Idh/MocA family oxidoreductase [Hymenobacteraceae bacterium]